MKFRPLLATDLSGSLGGIVASHNRGGAYFRNRAIPVDPGTPLQTILRGFMSLLSNSWVTILSAAQREAWDLYALQVPLPDPLGEPRNVGGIAMFNRSNVPRLQSGAVLVLSAPTIFNLGEFTPAGPFTVTAPASVSVAFVDTDEWVNEDDSHMLVLASAPRNASINFFKGPYRFMDKIDGDVTVPPTSPVVMTLPQVASAGQKVFFQVRVSRADGRLSALQRLESLVA